TTKPLQAMRVYWFCCAGCLLVSLAFGQGAAPGAKADVRDRRAKVTQGIDSARLDGTGSSHATLTIKTKAELVSRMRLLDATGNEVHMNRSADGTLQAEVDPKKGFILTRPPGERASLTPEGAHLPARYVTFSPTGATN